MIDYEDEEDLYEVECCECGRINVLDKNSPWSETDQLDGKGWFKQSGKYYCEKCRLY